MSKRSDKMPPREMLTEGGEIEEGYKKTYENTIQNSSYDYQAVRKQQWAERRSLPIPTPKDQAPVERFTPGRKLGGKSNQLGAQQDPDVYRQAGTFEFEAESFGDEKVGKRYGEDLGIDPQIKRKIAFSNTPSDHTLSQEMHESLISIIQSTPEDFNRSLEAAHLSSRDKAILFNMRDESGRTLLHYAASIGNKDIIGVLVQGGAELDIKDSIGDTPLHIAAYNGELEVTKELLARGANSSIKNEDNKTPQEMMESFVTTPIDGRNTTQDESIRTHLKEAAMKDSFINAKNLDHLDIAEDALIANIGSFLNAGVVNKATGMNILHYAVSKGYKQAVEELLKEDIVKEKMLNQASLKGNTPLHVAVICDEADIVKQFIINGADPNARNNAHQEPLELIQDNKKIKRLIEVAKSVIRDREEKRERAAMQLEENRSRSIHRSEVPIITNDTRIEAHAPIPGKALVKDELEEKLAKWHEYTAKKFKIDAPDRARDEIAKNLVKRNKESYQNLQPEIKAAERGAQVEYIGLKEEPLRASNFKVEGIEVSIAFDSKDKMYLSKTALEEIQKKKINCCFTIEGKDGNKDEYLEFRAGKLFIIDHGPGQEGTSLVGGKQDLINAYEQNKTKSVSRDAPEHVAAVGHSKTRRRAHSNLDLSRGSELSDRMSRIQSRANFEVMSRPEELDAYGKRLELEIAKLSAKIEKDRQERDSTLAQLHTVDEKKAKVEGKLQGAGMKLKSHDDSELVVHSGKMFGAVREILYRKTLKEAREQVGEYNNSRDLREQMAQKSQQISIDQKTLGMLYERKAEQTFDRVVLTLIEKHYGKMTAGDVGGNDLGAVYLKHREMLREKLKHNNPDLNFITLKETDIEGKYLDQIVKTMRQEILNPLARAERSSSLAPELEIKEVKKSVIDQLRERGKPVRSSTIMHEASVRDVRLQPTPFGNIPSYGGRGSREGA